MEMAGPPVWLVLLRGAHDAALLAALGSLAFGPCMLARDLAPRMAPTLRRAAAVSGALALASGAAWFLAETATVAEARGLGATLAAVPEFIIYLQFARVLLARLLLLAAALALLRLPSAALGLVAMAAAVQPWLGHAGQVGDALAASEVLHMVAASIWLGGLPPLLLCTIRLPGREAARVLRRFTPVAFAAVTTLAGSGLAQGFVLAGGAAGLTGTTYGHVALLKLGLFALALVCAALNALVLTPRLRAGAVPRRLRQSIGAEATIGLAIVLAAGWLANLSPGAR